MKILFLRLSKKLRGMNGEEIFKLSKNELDRLTNEHESARVYALLAQQKQLSGVRFIHLLFVCMLIKIYIFSF